MRPTLLIVDDHAGFRALARRLLEAEGFDVVGEADSAISAVDAVARLAPDVVLVDIALPDGNGFDVCDTILGPGGQPGTDEGPRVVLTSSRDISSFRLRLARSRARGFVPKNDLSGPALRALTE